MLIHRNGLRFASLACALICLLAGCEKDGSLARGAGAVTHSPSAPAPAPPPSQPSEPRLAGAPEPAAPSPLGAAAFAGDLAGVKMLLDSGAELDARAHAGRTPLMFALANYIGEPAAKSGASSEAPSERRRRSHKLTIARLLVERGADVRRSSELGLTALHYLAMTAPADEGALIEVAQVLLRAGALVDARTQTGTTPLRLAVDRGRIQLARFLVQSGADALSADAQGKTPLESAQQSGSAALVAALRR
jgi:ankyrin repeat protein